METGQQVPDKSLAPLFRSRTEHALDDKGRLNIPARFREVLQRAYTENLVVTNWHKCLKAYPIPEWQKFEAKLLGEAGNIPGFGEFVRYVISGVVECPLDKQGRILLPPTLRAEFGLTRDVVLNGMMNHFEIWDKGAWQEESRATRGNFKNFEQGFSSLGIL